jgi:hypothetical protein
MNGTWGKSWNEKIGIFDEMKEVGVWSEICVVDFEHVARTIEKALALAISTKLFETITASKTPIRRPIVPEMINLMILSSRLIGSVASSSVPSELS